MTIRHLSQPIAGLLRNNPVGTLDFVLDDKGNPLSDAEARVRLNEMLNQGQKYLPTNSKCVGFDPVKGCPGHEPLAGSDLTRAMLKRGDASVPCAVSGTVEGDSDDSAVFDLSEGTERLRIIVSYDGESFITDTNKAYLFAVPVLVRPLTANEVGL